MSSSSDDDFFDDTESESNGKEEGREELGNVVRERSESDSVSTENSSSEGDGAKRLEKDSEDQKNDDYSDDCDSDDISESVHETSQNENDRESGDEPDRDRSDELERLFDVSPADITSTPPSPEHSGSRPTSDRCRVRVVVESPHGYSSSKKDHTGTRVKGKLIPSAKTMAICRRLVL